ncbi:MAG: hypothetical protein H6Q59_2750, partial [Firmicutes bacterium]|nr:hypothetical protein [Bacillota bacterium]
MRDVIVRVKGTGREEVIDQITTTEKDRRSRVRSKEVIRSNKRISGISRISRIGNCVKTVVLTAMLLLELTGCSKYLPMTNKEPRMVESAKIEEKVREANEDKVATEVTQNEK